MALARPECQCLAPGLLQDASCRPPVAWPCRARVGVHGRAGQGEGGRPGEDGRPGPGEVRAAGGCLSAPEGRPRPSHGPQEAGRGGRGWLHSPVGSEAWKGSILARLLGGSLPSCCSAMASLFTTRCSTRTRGPPSTPLLRCVACLWRARAPGRASSRL